MRTRKVMLASHSTYRKSIFLPELDPLFLQGIWVRCRSVRWRTESSYPFYYSRHPIDDFTGGTCRPVKIRRSLDGFAIQILPNLRNSGIQFPLHELLRIIALQVGASLAIR